MDGKATMSQNSSHTSESSSPRSSSAAQGKAATSQASPDDSSTVRVTSSTLKAAVSAHAREKKEPYIPPVLVASAAWGWRIIVVLLLAGLLLWGLGYIKTVTIPVAIALLFTVLLQPVDRFLRTKLRFPRALSAVTAVIFLIAFLAGLMTAAGTQVSSGIGQLSQQAIKGFNELLTWAQGAPLNLDLHNIDSVWNEFLQNVQQYMSTILDGALTVTTTVGHVLAGLLITVFCTIFFLKDGRQIWTWIIGLLPRHLRERSHQAGRRGLVTLSSYVRTQILVAFIDAVGIGLGAAAIGLPLVIPLAALVFLGSFIPFVGAIVTGAIAVLVALVVKGWILALVMLGIVLLVQQIEGHILQPFLMGRAVSLHPVAVLLAVTGGTVLAGIVGALFAVPLVAVLNTVILYLNGHDKFPELGFDDHIDIRPQGRRAVMVTSATRYVSEGAWDEEVPAEKGAAPLEKFLSRFQNRGEGSEAEPTNPDTSLEVSDDHAPKPPADGS